MSGLGLEGDQLAFDLDLLQREQVAASPWSGAPLGYTQDYFTPAELAAARDRYIAEHGNFGSAIASHMWFEACAFRPFQTDQHSMHLLTATTRCEIATHDHSPGDLPPSGRGYQVNCEPCRWHSIADDENSAVEAWHDHALPGWRELPLVPHRLTSKPGWDYEHRSRSAVAAWVAEHYPAPFQAPGCPILTQREPGMGRHVPNRSPQGGYDMTIAGPNEIPPGPTTGHLTHIGSATSTSPTTTATAD